MLFSELKNLPADQDTRRISLQKIQELLPQTPVTVATQFYSDHGNNHGFQQAYAHIDLSSITWKLVSHSAEELRDADMNADFRRWFETVDSRVDQFAIRGWSCIDTREEVIKHWQENATWMENPIFISGALLNLSSPLRLVEGHTRLGILSGLVRNNVISSESMHKIWMGTTRE